MQFECGFNSLIIMLLTSATTPGQNIHDYKYSFFGLIASGLRRHVSGMKKAQTLARHVLGACSTRVRRVGHALGMRQARVKHALMG